MIEALATALNEGLQVKITYPGERTQPYYKYVINRREANIVVYQAYRAYVFKTLNGWLKQRAFAMRMHNEHKAQIADQLRLVLGIFERGTLKNICINVNSHRDNYEFLAPSEKSKRMRKHYETRILPVLNFCAEMRGI